MLPALWSSSHTVLTSSLLLGLVLSPGEQEGPPGVGFLPPSPGASQPRNLFHVVLQGHLAAYQVCQ